ncbi:hypothetical protein SAMN02982994_5839 [Azospirillum lipoferum]|nr:hypothetical protein SAMN02982994_5839 [Azospirillum lipoferum]
MASASEPVIAVVDSVSDTVVMRIPLPGPARQTVVLERGAKLVVSDGVGRKLSVIETSSGTLDRELATSVVPVMLQIDRTGTLLAVGDPSAGSVEIIRSLGAATVTIPGLPGLRSILFDSSNRLLVAYGHRIAVIDTQAGRVLTELAVEAGKGAITQLATDPGRSYLFALQGDQGLVSIFDLKTLARSARLVLPAPLGSALPSADSQFMLVPVAGGRAVSVVSTWTLKESRRLAMAAPVTGIGLGVFQTVSIGMSRTARSVQAVDLRDRRSLGILPLPGVPEAGALAATGLKYYVTLADSGQLAVLDLLRTSVLSLIDTSVRGAAMVVPAVGYSDCH